MKFDKTTERQHAVHIELERLVDPNHPLTQLSSSIKWEALELSFRPPNNTALSTRQMLALHYLRGTYGLSDREVIEKTKTSPYYQYFCGFKYFSAELPIEVEDMENWRSRLGGKWSVDLIVAAMEAEQRPEALLNCELTEKEVLARR